VCSRRSSTTTLCPSLPTTIQSMFDGKLESF
jgi:hypothetical protein